MSLVGGEQHKTPGTAFWFPFFRGFALRPPLWLPALRQLVRAVPRGWWRRPPFLPRPDRAYLQYRLETAYGHEGSPSAADLLRYLDWCRTTDGAKRARAVGRAGH